MEKINVAIIGFGNLGQYALQAALAEPDINVCGVVNSSKAGQHCIGLKQPIVATVEELDKPDVALLCVPSLAVPTVAPKYLALGIATVDAFDIHGQAINELKSNLARAAIAGNCAAIIAAGWDPGVDSLLRAILKVAIPRGYSSTNYGPGMSLGHSTAARAIEGVADAISLTYPLGYGKHRREVYVELAPGASTEQVTARILANPYFVNDETNVTITTDISMYKDYGHACSLERKGVAAETHNQQISCRVNINNPAVTSQMMVSAARAIKHCQPGAYSLLDLPLKYLFNADDQALTAELI